VPCYNEELNLDETLFRLESFVKSLTDFSVEVIFVDDGSVDSTLKILKNASQSSSLFKVVSFSRNFGHQLAVTAGVNASSGDAVVLMDADLQDPPEVIHQMIEKYREGYDVVYGTRTLRRGETFFKKITAKFFYKILNRLSDVPIPKDTGDFRLMSRRVVNILNEMPEKDRFIRGMVSWIGFQQISIKYVRQERFAGETKYPLKRMLSFALDGILSFSSKPLKIAINLGMFCAFLALIGIFYALGLKFFTDVWIVKGWTALMIAILFMGGVQLVCIGILGEYVGRTYIESKNRPLYVVKEKIGFLD
jgi:dolichol-phosphate mannosyltransferase